MFCSSCGKELSDKAVMCPNCQTMIKNIKNEKSSKTRIITIIAIIFIVIGGISSSFSELSLETDLKNIENQVVEDAIEQYNIAARQGDEIQICVQAGFVTAALLQAKDEVRYNEWKEIERKACEYLGRPY